MARPASVFVRAILCAAVILVGACGRDDGKDLGKKNEVRPRTLAVGEIEPLVGARTGRRAWAAAIERGLQELRLPVDRPHVCSVIAVIAQESGFEADPAVPGLARLVKERLAAYEAKLGPLGRPVFKRLLSGRAEGDPLTFEQRLDRVRTERDVDRIFRDMMAHHRAHHPAVFTVVQLTTGILDLPGLDELNPITTAGAMQVSVRFAESWAERHGRPVEAVREALYTRDGGVLFGAARLFEHRAAYESPIYRFADYNAGVYASRNAALQAQLARLVGTTLALDGDFLRYDRGGDVEETATATMGALLLFQQRHAPDLSPRQMERDARKEKTRAFEETETYAAVKRVYADRFGVQPPYAALPKVEIESPKLSRRRSTAWFAQSVNRRYAACMNP